MNTNDTEQSPMDELLTTKEAAAFLRISVWALCHMVREGKMAVRKYGAKGRAWRFLKSDLLLPSEVVQRPVLQAVPPPPAPRPDSNSGKRLTRENGVLRYR